MAAGRTRIQMRCTIPELNPEMDVYRVGTLLEWVREIATQIAEDGKCGFPLCTSLPLTPSQTSLKAQHRY
jgi:hypothetical protein